MWQIRGSVLLSPESRSSSACHLCQISSLDSSPPAEHESDLVLDFRALKAQWGPLPGAQKLYIMASQ